MNRLSSVIEGTNWGQNYGFDAVGNRWVSTGTSFDSFTPVGSANPFDANNHLTTSSAAYGDGRGNMTAIGGYVYTYDAENRLIQSTLTGTTTYTYDADGRRVTKTMPGGMVTTYVYDAQGNLAAEYTSNGTAPTLPCTTCYLMADHLGSTRMYTDGAGAQQALFDYAPFGETLASGVDGRDARWPAAQGGGYGLHFTGKEQEGVEGDYMDYFGARYYAGGLGRFSSPDVINATAARLHGPSNTLNKYIYAANNPLKFIDPDGDDITIYYRHSKGLFTMDFGHIFIGALDQSTGAVAFLDYWALSGPPGPGVANKNMTLDRLRDHASITIQTTPEAAEKLIGEIDKIVASPPDFTLQGSLSGPRGRSCTTVCQDVLREVGIDLNAGYLPYDVWNEAFERFSPYGRGSVSPLMERSWAMPAVRASAPDTPGKDFGSFRYRGVDPNLLMFWLYQNRNRPAPRACVAVTDSASGYSRTSCQ